MCAYHLQPLPFRRLVEYANGLWDETRKTFYPFVSSYQMVAAKNGIHYYISNIAISVTNEGDHAAGYAQVSWSDLSGITRYIRCTVPVTVAAANVNVANSLNSNIGILCNVGTAITLSSSASSYSVTIVYAEIPADDAGGVLVVNDR